MHFLLYLIATILIWFMQNFDIRLNVVADSRQSILAVLAGMITPLFKPLGFGDWRLVTAILTGVMAKEKCSIYDIKFYLEVLIEMVLLYSCGCNVISCVLSFVYTLCCGNCLS